MESARRLGVDSKECRVFEYALSRVRSAKAAGRFAVAVPDTRFETVEKAVFEAEATRSFCLITRRLLHHERHRQ